MLRPLARIAPALALLFAAHVLLADDAPKAAGRSNRLAGETSPYLLLHARNPVDWYPWGPEALARAKAEDRPIFLSVGYSACYWCHVMERECFADPAIAKLMNERFVCIKVDREERPDVDAIYMAALQAFGQGGWPMSIFLTPDGRPIFGGTYYPPKARNGIPGFPELLDAIRDAWRDERAKVEEGATKLAEDVRNATDTAGFLATARRPLTRTLAGRGLPSLYAQYDPKFAGFGFEAPRPDMGRPKFPEPVNLVYLLDLDRREPSDAAVKSSPRSMALATLDHMARGGIRDHLGGGYHRYSTRRDWSVPHFEKMLYDNAQLASAHLLAFERTGDPRWRAEAEATFAFVARSLTAPEGGHYASLDAESNGEEGACYLWTRDQVAAVLGPDTALFAAAYGLDLPPNAEGGRHVLLEPGPVANLPDPRLAPLRAKLLAARDARPAPTLDDKVVTSWNGLMIAAHADGYRVLKDDRYRQAADRAADFLWGSLRTPEGRLLRTHRAGRSKLNGYLEDYAFFAHGLLRLHAATGDPNRLAQARALVDRMIADFSDSKAGGFFDTSDDHESLLSRPKNAYDNALPAGNSLAIRDLVALHALTGEPRDLDLAGRALDAFSSTLSRSPAGAPLMLVALNEYLDAREPGSRPPAAPAPEPDVDDAPLTPRAVLTARVAADLNALPGSEVIIPLDLRVQAGWHIYANPTRSATAPPTLVTLSDVDAALASVDYPAGEVKTLAGSGTDPVSVYEGVVRLTARVKIPADAKPGPLALAFKVRYQACNDRACLAPATLSVPARLEVKAR